MKRDRSMKDAMRAPSGRTAVGAALCCALSVVLGCVSDGRVGNAPESPPSRRGSAAAAVFPGPVVWDASVRSGIDAAGFPEFTRRDEALSARRGDRLLDVTGWPTQQPGQEQRRVPPIWSRWGRSF